MFLQSNHVLQCRKTILELIQNRELNYHYYERLLPQGISPIQHPRGKSMEGEHLQKVLRAERTHLQQNYRKGSV
jgi:PP-loop superfamily ATP-utilizing enzyme